MFVYKITNKINSKSYIGITNNYHKRWGNHKSTAFNKKDKQYYKPLYCAFRKYGLENFNFEILEQGLSLEEANNKEQEYIIFYHSLINEQGYNIAKGGGGSTGVSHYGAENANANLTEEEAQYILDHRDQPEYLLYEDFAEKISYGAFKNIYLGKTYTNLHTTTPIYPFNLEFSSQFTGTGKLTYEEVVELRKMYAKGIDWKIPYESKYKELYPNPMVFWGIYVGRKYKLVMPEVFTEELRHSFASKRQSGENNGRSKLTEQDVKKIRQLKKENVSNSDIYKLYPHITPVSIRNVINYKTWKNID